MRADNLPAGVKLRPLTPHGDDRGRFTELYREEWNAGVTPVQWNAVRSEPGVLRGVHVHVRHDDYLVIHEGHATVGLCDLREESPTAGVATCVEMDGEEPAAIVIPTGVAHGFLFTKPSLHIYAVSHYWDMADELGCRWDDPELGIPWPDVTPRISPRDEALPPLAELRPLLRSAAADLSAA